MLSELKKLTNVLSSFYSNSNNTLGAAPGEVKIKKNQFPPLEMQIINYNSDYYKANPIEDITQNPELSQDEVISWLIVNGFGGNAFLEKLKTDLGFHGLTVEDILNVNHQPKLEFLEDSLFVVLRLVAPADSGIDCSISIVVADSNLYLFSPTEKFQLANKLIQRIEKKRGKIRNKGVDYLLFAIIDLIVDSYFPQIDMVANSIKEIDQNLFENKNNKILHDVKTIRQILNIYFDNLNPISDMIARLIREDSDFVDENNLKYFHHIKNHVSFLCDRINRLKESTSDIMNLNISMNGQKMNEIMKVLTMMSSIFIPLSFVCGLYGMNFNSSKSPLNMPELDWYYGYPFALGVMMVITIAMALFFFKKKWF